MQYVRVLGLAAVGVCLVSARLSFAAAVESDAAEIAAEKPQEPKETNPKPLKLANHETAIYVGKMHCKTCARKISSKLFTLKGVKQVRSDVKANLTIVVSEPKQPLDPVKAWAAVQAAGFKPTKLIGPAGTYVPHKDAKKTAPVKLAEKSEKPAAATTR
ncbi:MAG: heavy-metal-associated domain-containing protein [Planctomycetales bacterium]|nr:heavy-metal-associated domain-containing protein [Planctomycetales bacterium]